MGEDSPYEPTSCTFFNVKGLTDTLASVGFDVAKITRLVNQEHPRGAPLPDKPDVDRCVVVATKNAAGLDVKLSRYWRGEPTQHDWFPWRREGDS